MALNKDGLEPGQVVDFETLQRVLRQQQGAKDAKPEQRAEKEVHGSSERESEDLPKSTRKKAAKKS